MRNNKFTVANRGVHNNMLMDGCALKPPSFVATLIPVHGTLNLADDGRQTGGIRDHDNTI